MAFEEIELVWDPAVEDRIKLGGNVAEIISRQFDSKDLELVDVLYYKKQLHFMNNISKVTRIEKNIALLDLMPNSNHLVTSAKMATAQALLDYFELFPKFKCITAYESTALHKPYPDPYIHSKSHSEGKDVHFAIEDSLQGINSALSAGMYVVFAQSTHNFLDFSNKLPV